MRAPYVSDLGPLLLGLVAREERQAAADRLRTWAHAAECDAITTHGDDRGWHAAWAFAVGFGWAADSAMESSPAPNAAWWRLRREADVVLYHCCCPSCPGLPWAASGSAPHPCRS